MIRPPKHLYMRTQSNITHTASKLCETQKYIRSLHCSRDINWSPDFWSTYIKIEIHFKYMLWTKACNTLLKGLTNDHTCACIYCLAGWQHGTGQWWRWGTISRGHGSLPFDEAAHCGGTRPKVTHIHTTLQPTISDVSVSQEVCLLYNC